MKKKNPSFSHFCEKFSIFGENVGTIHDGIVSALAISPIEQLSVRVFFL